MFQVPENVPLEPSPTPAVPHTVAIKIDHGTGEVTKDLQAEEIAEKKERECTKVNL